MVTVCKSHSPIHHAHVNSKAAPIQPALIHDSRKRFDAMMISPAVDSTWVTAAAYTNDNSTRMNSYACIRDLLPSFVSPDDVRIRCAGATRQSPRRPRFTTYGVRAAGASATSAAAGAGSTAPRRARRLPRV